MSLMLPFIPILDYTIAILLMVRRGTRVGNIVRLGKKEGLEDIEESRIEKFCG